ncbi:S-locus glycoprotein domain [Sesbania bispinosa]|nr:S-locus glycoprotein domain [Sesbania bispinosa]
MQMASSILLFALLLFLSLCQHSSSFSLSVEKPNQDIIVSSPKHIFTAGFYPVGENAYCFAIYFTQSHTNLHNAAIVWMANRDQPVNGKHSKLFILKTGREEWLMSGQINQEPCKIHGICGPNSLCSNHPKFGRKCSCIPGYSRVDKQDWSQGCKSNFQLPCNKTESRFQLLPRVDFYGYDPGYYENYTFEQCLNLCLQLCKCKGFQYRFFVNKGVYSCYPKMQLLNGHRSPGFPGKIYLRLPRNSDFSKESPVEDDNDDLVCSRNRTKQVERSYVKAKENGSVKFMLWKHFGANTQGKVLEAATGFQKFSYSELKQATKGFSQEIGRGAGGIVYKAILSDKRVAAIKRLYDANQGEKGKHRLLVYEYMENGSLAHNLSSNALDWSKRYNIAPGTARGLAYLHEECLEWILHCDIKPQNILLDSGYQPKEPNDGYQITDGTESHNERLVSWVREKRRNTSEVSSWMEEIADPALGSDYDINKLETLAMVALDCVEEEKDLRPSMSQVAERLHSHEHDS